MKRLLDPIARVQLRATTRQLSSRALEAQCLCGSVQLRLDADAEPSHAAAFCHCTICRAFHGAPFAMEAGFPVDACETSGATASYRSSRHFERRRCAACGTPCGAVHHKLGAIFLPTALFAKPGAPSPPPGFEPTMHIFYERRVVGDIFLLDSGDHGVDRSGNRHQDRVRLHLNAHAHPDERDGKGRECMWAGHWAAATRWRPPGRISRCRAAHRSDELAWCRRCHVSRSSGDGG